MARASGLKASYTFTPEGYSMIGGHTCEIPLCGHVSMGSSKPLASSSRNCCVIGPKLAQIEIIKWACFWCTFLISCLPLAKSSDRKSMAFHR